jgi:hypothetical protein
MSALEMGLGKEARGPWRRKGNWRSGADAARSARVQRIAWRGAESERFVSISDFRIRRSEGRCNCRVSGRRAVLESIRGRPKGAVGGYAPRGGNVCSC